MAQQMVKKKIGDILLEKGLVTQEQLNEVLREQSMTGRRIGELLVDRGIVTEDQVIDSVSERLNIPKISVKALVIDPEVIRRINVDVARRYTLIPILEIGTTLTVAMADPLNIIAVDEIRYLTGKTVKRTIASSSEIRTAIDQYYSVADSLNQIMGTSAETDQTARKQAPVVEAEPESPIIKLVNLIIRKAAKEKASDIHIEPEESRLRIRYRIDGVMREEAAPPKSMQNELISRIKIAANLDVSEKRLPQDGRFMLTLDTGHVDLRISTLPTIHGEKVVIRLLDRRNVKLSCKQLGFSPMAAERWHDLIKKPEGLLLITGPTSSGKTSTLYATLSDINSVEKNIITVEDPVEYSLPLVNQVQINDRAGLTYPAALRSILRQNPNIIMIGEIRDPETASMAIRSALTGHLVFSTIHTNDAPSTIARLVDMGIEPYLVASALKGILAQRLVRLNCQECLETYTPSQALIERAGLLELADVINFKRGTGCPTCRRSGYSGRTGIYELLEVTPAVSEMIIHNRPVQEIKDDARRNGYMPLFETGLEKLSNGTVCLEELLKQTSNFEDYERPKHSASYGESNVESISL